MVVLSEPQEERLSELYKQTQILAASFFMVVLSEEGERANTMAAITSLCTVYLDLTARIIASIPAFASPNNQTTLNIHELVLKTFDDMTGVMRRELARKEVLPLLGGPYRG